MIEHCFNYLFISDFLLMISTAMNGLTFCKKTAWFLKMYQKNIQFVQHIFMIHFLILKIVDGCYCNLTVHQQFSTEQNV